MKGFLSLFKALTSLSLLLLAIYFGGHITIDFMDKNIDIHMALCVFFLILLFYTYGFIKSLLLKFSVLFSGKPDHEKGLDNLQLAFSGILLKDSNLTQKSIRNAKKYLGNIPLVSWIEGQSLLMNKDYHRAKAVFYELSWREKSTILGAYGLCKMSLKNNQDIDIVNAIDAILKVSPNAFELVFQVLIIHLKNKEFIEAKKHIPAIRKTKNGRVVEAIIYAEEGYHTHDMELMRKAFKMAPELSENAMRYADLLVKNEEYHTARKILLKSFMHVQTIALYEKYISCEKSLTDSDKLKLAEKIMEEVSDSWIVYFEFAKLALKNGMTHIAFQNFLKAYKIKEYNFIADRLVESAKMLDVPKPESAIEVISHPLVSKSVAFVWECAHCENQESDNRIICENCGRIAEYKPKEKLSDISRLS